jgi:hypothetical protein
MLVYIFRGLVIKSTSILASKSIRGTSRSSAIENTRIITTKLAPILLPWPLTTLVNLDIFKLYRL